MFKAIEERRTCRQFDPSRAIPRDVIEKIARAGVNAPTGVDAQSFDLYFVSKQEILNRVATEAIKNLPPVFASKNLQPENIFYRAPTVCFIVPAREERADCVNYDLGIIADSLCIEAQLSGVSSAIIGLAGCCPASVMKEVLGLQKEATAIGVCLGYAAPEWKPQEKEIRSKVHWIE